MVAAEGRLPVPNFAAGGIATPADAALDDARWAPRPCSSAPGSSSPASPQQRARAIVRATTHHADARAVAEVSRGLGEAMRGLDVAAIPAGERLQERGW